jgi:D-glycero-D-manno-heptose 1,7-bisphosphate phosphatase
MSKRAVFFDRDGTLVEHFDYITDEKQLRLLPATVPALRLLRDRGLLLVMVTNQSVVARGMITEKKLLQIHDHLKFLLGEQGVYLDRLYYCPFHPEAVVEKYRRESPLRKPAPGMLQLAAQELDLDLSQCWMVGDDDRDIEAEIFRADRKDCHDGSAIAFAACCFRCFADA